MDRRDGADEHLDGPLDDQPTLVGNLRDLRRLNRLSGGVALSRWGVNRLLDGTAEPSTLIDVGTGGADIPVALLADSVWRGRRLEVTAVDSRAEVLARRALPARSWIAIQRLRLALVDPERLPYQNETFDVGHASLVLHHLDEDPAVRFLAELGRVSRRGVVVNDLHRGGLGLFGAWLPAASSPGTTTRATTRCCPSGGRTRSPRSRRCCAGPGSSRSIGGRPPSGSATRSSRFRPPPPRDRRRGRDRRRRAGRGDRRALLARAGHDVTVFERSPAYRWRACGVFASPATVAALHRVGLDEATLAGSPGRSRRCASRHRRDRVPTAVRRRRSRSGSTARRSIRRSSTRRERPAPRSAPAPGSRRCAGRAAAGAPCAHGRAWSGTRPGSWSGPMAATRSSRGRGRRPTRPARAARGPHLPPRGPSPAIPAPTRGCACSATGTSASPRCPADG